MAASACHHGCAWQQSASLYALIWRYLLGSSLSTYAKSANPICSTTLVYMILHRLLSTKRAKVALLATCAAVVITASGALYLRNELTSHGVTHLSLETIAPLPKLKVGDLIFRMGVSADSYIIAEVTDSKYSHMGIISEVEPEILVTHATTADDAGSLYEGVITIPLKNFVSEASALAIARYPQLSDEDIPAIVSFLKSKEGAPFVLTSSPSALYCSSLVQFALQDHLKLNIKRSYISLPGVAGNYLFPQAFINDPNLKIIYVFDDPSAKAESNPQSD